MEAQELQDLIQNVQTHLVTRVAASDIIGMTQVQLSGMLGKPENAIHTHITSEYEIGGRSFLSRSEVETYGTWRVENKANKAQAKIDADAEKIVAAELRATTRDEKAASKAVADAEKVKVQAAKAEVKAKADADKALEVASRAAAKVTADAIAAAEAEAAKAAAGPYDDLNLVELRQKARGMDIKPSGTKPQLIERILAQEAGRGEDEESAGATALDDLIAE